MLTQYTTISGGPPDASGGFEECKFSEPSSAERKEASDKLLRTVCERLRDSRQEARMARAGAWAVGPPRLKLF